MSLCTPSKRLSSGQRPRSVGGTTPVGRGTVPLTQGEGKDKEKCVDFGQGVLGSIGWWGCGVRDEGAVLGERQMSGRCRREAGGRAVVRKHENGGKGIGDKRKEFRGPSGEEGERREAG